MQRMANAEMYQEPSAKLVADEVAAYMGRRRMSQTALGQLLGISQPAASRRLSGEIPFDVDELYTLAEHFKCSPADFFPTGSRTGSNRHLTLVSVEDDPESPTDPTPPVLRLAS